MNTIDRAAQIVALQEAHDTLNALEYEAHGFDPSALQRPIPADHPGRDWIEELICARHAVHVVMTKLRHRG